MIQSARRDVERAECASTDGDRTADCPLCGAALEDSTQVYAHLQTTHRKSELAELAAER